MEIELRLQGVPYVAKKPLALEYKSCLLQSTYEPDFVCYELIVLELKAVTELVDEHRAQVQNYLKATGLRLGLLVNFGIIRRRKWNVLWLSVAGIRRDEILTAKYAKHAKKTDEYN